MKIIIAILIFGVIIAIHELGHFTVAKLCGIRVNKFAIGMGPVLFKFVKGEEKYHFKFIPSILGDIKETIPDGATEYSLRLFPIGGFCAMEGEDESSEDDRAFNKKPPLQRVAVVAAGAIMNLLLGFILIVILTCMSDNKIPTTQIDTFKYNSTSNTCENALMPDDVITKIEGSHIFTTQDMAYEISSNKSPYTVEVERDGKKVTLEDVKFYYYYYYRYVLNTDMKDYGPYFKYNAREQKFDEVKQDDIDISNFYYYYDDTVDDYVQVSFYTADKADGVSNEIQKYESNYDYYVHGQEKNFATVLIHSAKYSLSVVKLVWSSLIDLITGKYHISDMSGPVGIMNLINDSISSSETLKNNIMTLMDIAILITINLGVFNLFPLPALDGGRIVFLLVEIIRGKPVKPEHEGMVHFIGLALFMILMIFVTFNDIKTIFF